MSQITRNPMTRGTTVSPGAVMDSLEAAASDIEAIQINATNLKTPRAVFHVRHSVPYIASDWSSVHNRPDVSDDFFTLPFYLPPLQGELTRQFSLEAFSLGFDTRGEAAAIVDQFYGNVQGNSTDDSKLDFSAQPYSMTVRIVEHTPTSEGNTNYDPTNVLFSAEIPSETWLSPAGNTSVLRFSCNSRAMRSGYCYAVQIKLPDLYGNDEATGHERWRVTNLVTDVEIATDLVSRGNDLPLIPTASYGDKTPRVVDLTPPATLSIISADESTPGEKVALNDQLNTVLDQYYRERMRAGYDESSRTYPNEQLETDAYYDIVMVPLFQNGWRAFGLSNDYDNQPYFSDTEGKIGGLTDQRFVPLVGSAELHHATLLYNWQTGAMNMVYNDPANLWPSPATEIPYQPNFQLEVGVNLCSYLRTDDFGYQNVAQITKLGAVFDDSPSTWNSRSIDRLRTQAVTLGQPGYEVPWTIEYDQIDILGSGGDGAYSQGPPVYLGVRDSTTQASVDLNGSPSDIEGQEDVVEIRAVISSTDGLNTISNGGSMEDNCLYYGYQGAWVQLTLRRTLA